MRALAEFPYVSFLLLIFCLLFVLLINAINFLGTTTPSSFSQLILPKTNVEEISNF